MLVRGLGKMGGRCVNRVAIIEQHAYKDLLTGVLLGAGDIFPDRFGRIGSSLFRFFPLSVYASAETKLV